MPFARVHSRSLLPYLSLAFTRDPCPLSLCPYRMMHRKQTQSENYFDNQVSLYIALFENGMIEPSELEKLAHRGQGQYNQIGEKHYQGHDCAATAQILFRDIVFHGLLVFSSGGTVREPPLPKHGIFKVNPRL